MLGVATVEVLEGLQEPTARGLILFKRNKAVNHWDINSPSMPCLGAFLGGSGKSVPKAIAWNKNVPSFQWKGLFGTVKKTYTVQSSTLLRDSAAFLLCVVPTHSQTSCQFPEGSVCSSPPVMQLSTDKGGMFLLQPTTPCTHLLEPLTQVIEQGLPKTARLLCKSDGNEIVLTTATSLTLSMTSSGMGRSQTGCKLHVHLLLEWTAVMRMQAQLHCKLPFNAGWALSSTKTLFYSLDCSSCSISSPVVSVPMLHLIQFAPDCFQLLLLLGLQ